MSVKKIKNSQEIESDAIYALRSGILRIYLLSKLDGSKNLNTLTEDIYQELNNNDDTGKIAGRSFRDLLKQILDCDLNNSYLEKVKVESGGSSYILTKRGRSWLEVQKIELNRILPNLGTNNTNINLEQLATKITINELVPIKFYQLSELEQLHKEIIQNKKAEINQKRNLSYLKRNLTETDHRFEDDYKQWLQVTFFSNKLSLNHFEKLKKLSLYSCILLAAIFFVLTYKNYQTHQFKQLIKVVSGSYFFFFSFLSLFYINFKIKDKLSFFQKRYEIFFTSFMLICSKSFFLFAILKYDSFIKLTGTFQIFQFNKTVIPYLFFTFLIRVTYRPCILWMRKGLKLNFDFLLKYERWFVNLPFLFALIIFATKNKELQEIFIYDNIYNSIGGIVLFLIGIIVVFSIDFFIYRNRVLYWIIYNQTVSRSSTAISAV